MTNELCIRCGKQTLYNIHTPIDMRKYYVEGSGQLCQDCFQFLYPKPTSLENNLGVDKRRDSNDSKAPCQPVNNND